MRKLYGHNGRDIFAGPSQDFPGGLVFLVDSVLDDCCIRIEMTSGEAVAFIASLGGYTAGMAREESLRSMWGDKLGYDPEREQAQKADETDAEMQQQAKAANMMPQDSMKGPGGK